MPDAVPILTPEALRAACDGHDLAFFLDYDGTLAPIVDQPELAFISDACRSMLSGLASTFPVAIVSGRSNDKLASCSSTLARCALSDRSR